MGVPQRVQMKAHGVETHWLSGKEKVTGAVVSKEGHFQILTLPGLSKIPLTIVLVQEKSSTTLASTCCVV